MANEITPELLQLEEIALRENHDLYLECFRYNGTSKLLRDRKTPEEIRNGLILFQVYETCKPKYEKKVTLHRGQWTWSVWKGITGINMGFAKSESSAKRKATYALKKWLKSLTNPKV